MSDIYAENHQNDPPDEGKCYVFERRVLGRLMAQGVRVNRAVSEAHARKIARQILLREVGNCGEVDVTDLVLVETIEK